MKILAVNSGSSSIKYRLFEGNDSFHNSFQLIGQGIAERIGHNSSSISLIKEHLPSKKENIFLPDHRTALHALFLDKNRALDKIDAVGHRIVHGGEQFKSTILIDKDVIQELKKLAQFAPIHCEPNIIGIEVLQELFPKIPQVAVFDTAAHASMNYKAFLYGIPLEYYEKYRIRKYGFHGINHLYVAQEAASFTKKSFEKMKIITCHLGSGCSITAFSKGKSIDNSMGLTPLEGLIMGTRCGDLDPSIVLYLIEKFELQVEQVRDLLNKKCGLLGLCGKNDMRDIIEAAKGDNYKGNKNKEDKNKEDKINGNNNFRIALEIFVYRIQKYIGAYIAALNGVDAIVFTGGIGENNAYIRMLIMENFSFLGAKIDKKKNENHSSIFSADTSSIFLMTIPANEEKIIAQQTYQMISEVK